MIEGPEIALRSVDAWGHSPHRESARTCSATGRRNTRSDSPFSESLNVSSRRNGVLITAVNPGFVPTEGFPATDRPSILSLTPERVAETIVKVVREGIAPEVSIPRWVAPLEAFRILTPSMYRWAVDRIASQYGPN